MPVSGKVWMQSPEYKYLVPPTAVYGSLIKPAQSFTISLRSCVVSRSYDRNTRNDLLISTRSSLGERPPLERVHFWEKDIRAGEVIEYPFSENVLLCEDYNGKDKVWLEWNVIEVDTDDGEREAIRDTLIHLASMLGAAFPVMVPYTATASLVIKTIEKILDRFEKDVFVIKTPFALYPTENQPLNNRPPLQTGLYVVFDRDVYGQGYKLDDQNRVWTSDNNPPKESYVVFDIYPQRSLEPAALLGQKTATLLTQIREKQNVPAGKSALDFLTETLKAYTDFTQLQRYRRLQAQPNRTPEEARMADIENNLDIKDLIEILRNAVH